MVIGDFPLLGRSSIVEYRLIVEAEETKQNSNLILSGLRLFFQNKEVVNLAVVWDSPRHHARPKRGIIEGDTESRSGRILWNLAVRIAPVLKNKSLSLETKKQTIQDFVNSREGIMDKRKHLKYLGLKLGRAQ